MIKTRAPISLITILACIIILSLGCFKYFPKWKNFGSEATISWDVSGYYFYLPAIFIYKDLKGISFKDEILQKYQPTFELQQASLLPNGNYVLRYSCGMAIQYFPFFYLAHIYASNSSYPADGFSRPYQFMISLGSILMAFLGLILIRLSLLHFFSDKTVAITIASVVLATNYLDYVAINGAMSHNYLFTIYAALIYSTIKFYKDPNFLKAAIIGALIGLAALSRPTEIILCLIPLLWGISLPIKESLDDKIIFFKTHKYKILLALIICGVIGSIQFLYWKYSAGEWIYYSYGNEGFDWLKPHIWKGLFSYTSGWFVYTPIMLFALAGFIPLYKKNKELALPGLIFIAIFIYIAFAWKNWWYGGSLGQRTMVQTYALLSFPLAALVDYILGRKYLKWTAFILLIVFGYYNFWLTHQSHKGGIFMAGQMTKSYFWSTLGKYSVSEDQLKLLDTEDVFFGSPIEPQTIYKNDFESYLLDSLSALPPINGGGSILLTGKQQWSKEFNIDVPPTNNTWLRATAKFRCKTKEWNWWQMAQFIVKSYSNGELVKYNQIRVFRILNQGETREIHTDIRIPDLGIDSVGIVFYNSESKIPLIIDDLTLESFQD